MHVGCRAEQQNIAGLKEAHNSSNDNALSASHNNPETMTAKASTVLLAVPSEYHSAHRRNAPCKFCSVPHISNNASNQLQCRQSQIKCPQCHPQCPEY